ncbi:MAG: hypothetical protein KBF37_10050 [Saprospiraceae bacterium]|jgi:hypothetical protein|nr:hypothetical protein [Saprospiraceae bacterium]MBP9210648.1 hypothetical protein [Saprospiraceae bacterium]MBV6473856.1 hypothetical protein [Saprospiraceae bacterium]
MPLHKWVLYLIALAYAGMGLFFLHFKPVAAPWHEVMAIACFGLAALRVYRATNYQIKS